jgi:hypothetical protein
MQDFARLMFWDEGGTYLVNEYSGTTYISYNKLKSAMSRLSVKVMITVMYLMKL